VSSTRHRIAELLAEARSPAEVAVLLGLARNTVYYHRDRLRREAAARGEPRPPGVAPPARRSVETREQVARLLAEGLSRAEIARRLGLRKATISYHARRLGSAVDDRCARRYDWKIVQAYYDAGHSVAECVTAFGFSRQTWHAAKRRGDIVARGAAMPIEDLLVADTPRGRFNIKRRLLLEGLKENRCERCGLFEWRGQPIGLALHHINGDRHDNRVENLELLCPNCHSQTENFSGRRPKRAA
jgi:DNA-binding CsgD family transcriptional regulator/5-methylcytosine-specific restriction endonuclease McrA